MPTEEEMDLAVQQTMSEAIPLLRALVLALGEARRPAAVMALFVTAGLISRADEPTLELPQFLGMARDMYTLSDKYIELFKARVQA